MIKKKAKCYFDLITETCHGNMRKKQIYVYYTP